MSKIIKVLNCILTFFSTHCVFQELGMRKAIGIRRERNEIYEVELTSDQVACISTSTILNYNCWLDHPSLSTLKFLFADLGQSSSLECESCQLRKHHHVSYPSQANKMADKPFDLVHSDIWGPCPLLLKLEFR